MGNPDAIPAFTDNYIWYYRNPHGGSIVVDPGDAGPVLRAVQEGLSIEAVFITHHHHDHIGGLAELLEHADVPCFGPVDARIEGISHPVGHGDGIRIDGFQPFTVWHVPGHTLSHIAFFNEDTLFCGDTLFSLGCGRLFEGSPEQMLSSLDLLASLPDETLVCCAHEYTESNQRFAAAAEPVNAARDAYRLEFMAKRAAGKPSLPSSIGREKACNPFLRVDHTESMTGLAERLGYMPESRLQRFSALRAWKDVF
ncbi:MAG: hydroxyacylglutathione hydrolase [Arenimonas sp.]|nr:hydroxyacylglutathione hydrolase [Arenimonas sp.]